MLKWWLAQGLKAATKEDRDLLCHCTRIEWDLARELEGWARGVGFGGRERGLFKEEQSQQGPRC